LGTSAWTDNLLDAVELGRETMKTLLFAGALALFASAAVAQGNIQSYSNNPHPSRSASSNDASKNPAAFVRQSQAQARYGRHHRKHKHHH
jgi:hypothetical protein